VYKQLICVGIYQLAIVYKQLSMCWYLPGGYCVQTIKYVLVSTSWLLCTNNLVCVGIYQVDIVYTHLSMCWYLDVILCYAQER